MYKCLCKRCGTEFESNRKNSVLCLECKIGHCVICGKEFKRNSDSINKETCSTNCLVFLKKQNGDYERQVEKFKNTCIERYGVEAPFQNIEIREKQKKTNLERYGVEYAIQNHDIQSKQKKTNLERYGVEYQAQRPEVVEEQKQHNVEKYGVENVSQSDDVKEKIRQTNLERYGVEYPSQNKEIYSKQQETNLEKFGVRNVFQNEEIKEKIKETNLEKYGVEHPLQNAHILEKMKSTNVSKFGCENPTQNFDIREKQKKTNVEKYGCEHILENQDVRKKIKETNLERYGCEYPTQNFEVSSKISQTKLNDFLESIENPEQRENYRLFCEDPSSYFAKFNSNPTYSDLCKDLGVTQTTISKHVIKFGFQNHIHIDHSRFEDEVVDFLKYLNENVVIIRNDHQIICPQEIDIYLPNYKLGIECNSTYIHNSSLPDGHGNEPKPKYYHKKKSLACEEKGVFLFHIFEWEWNQRRSVIQSMIKNLLGKCDERLYARKLKIVELTQSTTSEFLNENHRQGSINSPVRLGLITKDTNELVSVITFNKLRSGIGKGKDDDDETWELSRFCSKLNTVVVGGASKLFKFFTDHFEPQKIVSFSDIAHTRGTLYEKLGFKKISITDPGYCYLHINTDLMLSREQCQKQNLRKLFQDDTIDLDNKTEPQIMLEHGFVRMYDSGSIRWEWKR